MFSTTYLWLRRSVTTWAAIPILIGVNAYAVASEHLAWRFEYARAVDHAGLAIFLTGPTLAGVCAFEAWQTRRRLGALAVGLPYPDRLRLGPWQAGLAWAAIFQTLALGVHLGIAVAAGAVGPVPVWPVVIQYATVAGYAALGCLTGWLVRSPIAAPALAIGIVLLNVLGPAQGIPVRRLTEAGTGARDLMGLTYAPTIAGLQVAAYAGLVAVMLAWTARGRTVRRVAVGTGLAIAVGASSVLVAGTSPRLVADEHLVVTCTDGEPTVCAPDEIDAGQRRQLAQELSAGLAVLHANGVTATPDRFEVELPWRAPSPHTGMLAISPETARDPANLRIAATVALTQPSWCDPTDPAAPPPPDVVMLARTALSAWLAGQLHLPVADNFPPELAQSINAMPEPQRRAWLARTYESLWQCRHDEVKPPAGFPTS